MLDVTNNVALNSENVLTIEDRKNILNRAIHSQNFFSQMEFDLPIGGAPVYNAKAVVNKDFYLTQIASDLASTSDLANLALKLYIGNKGVSIFDYITDASLPCGFQTYVPRTNNATSPTPVSTFCDKQYEIAPYFVPRNSSIIGEVSVSSGPIGRLLLGGYYPLARAYINSISTRGINESLSMKPHYEWWSFEIDHAATNQFTNIVTNQSLENDRFARLVLGFARVTNNANTDGAFGTVSILDPSRGIRFSDVPLSLGLLAPQTGKAEAGAAALDTNVYYLPIEHFWQPFASLKFAINWTPIFSTSMKFYMLTRTV